ncbi:hypothetical protein MHH52_26765 [Paenibacillus sp. FSL K6-0276]|uniref:GNAT family N-acetyltransferase n=1 Tax=Paenibacillus sp. FSL K6-0276 TaxID=2921450 RepID=UPI0030EF3B66
MELRDVKQDDVKWMWECRNEVESRNNSLHIEEISLREHILWVEQSLFMTNRKLMIAWNEGQRIAVVRLDGIGHKAIVSINVAKEHRGKGHSLEILSELEYASLTWNPNIQFLQANIKKENTMSIKAFIKSGYRQYKDEGQLQVMQKQIIFEEGVENEGTAE